MVSSSAGNVASPATDTAARADSAQPHYLPNKFKPVVSEQAAAGEDAEGISQFSSSQQTPEPSTKRAA